LFWIVQQAFAKNDLTMHPSLFQKQVRSVRVTRYASEACEKFEDEVVVEEPLEIRLATAGREEQMRTLSITMRTPGNDAQLALGFLFTEGIIGARGDVVGVDQPRRRVGDTVHENTIDILLRSDMHIDWSDQERHFYTASSCGVCGKGSMEMVRQQSVYLLRPGWPQVQIGLIQSLPEHLSDEQSVFARTGGLHAAALVTPEGSILATYEDVGRHNALDKLIGYALEEDLLPLRNAQIILSGRIGFELVQKAWMAGVPVLSAVGAPSSLAIDLAEECGMTLIGFVRSDRCTVYTGDERVNWGKGELGKG
jgi:FdhD protein